MFMRSEIPLVRASMSEAALCHLTSATLLVPPFEGIRSTFWCEEEWLIAFSAAVIALSSVVSEPAACVSKQRLGRLMFVINSSRGAIMS